MDKKILIATAAAAAAVIGGISLLRNKRSDSRNDLDNPDLVAAVALASTDMSDMSVDAITVIINALVSSLMTIKINNIIERETLDDVVLEFTNRANTRLDELTISVGDVANITHAYERLNALIEVMETILHHV